MTSINEKIEVVVKFRTAEEGGRTEGNPACLKGNVYRPLFVRKDDAQKNYIGVMFESGTERATPGQEWNAVVIVLFVSREMLPPGTHFDIKEGTKTVGEGRVSEWLN